MSRTRTFVAVETSGEVQSRAAELIRRLRVVDAKVSWVLPANMHITLKFLGDQPDDAVAEICQAVQEGAAGVAPFEFLCRGAGAFPDLRRPRTLWLGVQGGLDEFVELHTAIDAALARRRFPKDRRGFRPHLTLGRVRQVGSDGEQMVRLLQEHEQFEGGVTAVDEVVVFASELTRSGPQYEVLARAPLAG
jgi:2'-5' RNA ligase